MNARAAYATFFLFITSLLLILVLIKISKFVNYYSQYDAYMQQQKTAASIIKARNDLKEIDSSHSRIQPLVRICLKTIRPPILISEIEGCRDKAVGYLGFSQTYKEIKTLAGTPLPSEIVQIIEKEAK